MSSEQCEKISTITMSTQFPKCALNLINIGKYLEIDNIIIGLKYNFANLSVIKGKYLTTIYKKAKIKDNEKINKRLFYNQISIIINNNGNHVNVKLFNNGSVHLTGCKYLTEGKDILKLLYQKLSTLSEKKDTLLLSSDVNNILLDTNNLVYGYNTHNIIGYKKDKHTYVIHKKEYTIDIKTGMFISKKIETQRKKHILNLDGEDIGFWKIELLKNKNKLYNKNQKVFYDYTNDLIYYNNTTIIGRFVYQIDQNKKTQLKDQSVLEIEYNCNPFINGYTFDSKDICIDINCINVYFKIPYEINRQRFYQLLIDLEYICKYKPESYSGIKFIYKLPINEHHGHREHGYCNCTNKCVCRNITFLIFQSGNVIATGFKTEEEIEKCCHNFKQICNENEFIIKKRQLLT